MMSKNEQFTNDLRENKPLREMAAKYGRDYMKNYKQYRAFACDMMHQETGEIPDWYRKGGIGMKPIKTILMSIHGDWAEKILSGEKTVEIRRTAPVSEKPPFVVYLYVTERPKCENSGKIVGSFECREIEEFTTDYRSNDEQNERISHDSCVPLPELADYEAMGNSPCLYAWHISNVQKFVAPQYGYYGFWFGADGRLLSRPPQSWRYVD